MTKVRCSDLRKLPPEHVRQRFAVIDSVIASGGCLAHAARQIGITSPALIYFLRREGREDLHNALKGGRWNSEVSPAEARRRLLAATQAPTLVAASRELGLSPPTLCTWLRKNAPDGPQSALADMEEAA